MAWSSGTKHNLARENFTGYIRVDIQHTSSALQYKPAFMATWYSVGFGVCGPRFDSRREE